MSPRQSLSSSTIEALDQVNRQFYSRGAEAFDRTRTGPWSGWLEVVDRFQRTRTGMGKSPGEKIKVLDVGCGNGRFGTFLANAMESTLIDYSGVDRSPELLEAARSSLAAVDGLTVRRIAVVNLLGDDFGGAPNLIDDQAEDKTQSFDLVVCFGVMHHVPQPLQSHLLQRCLQAAAPDGTAVISFWQFAELSRFEERRLNWSWAVERGMLTTTQRLELDQNDWLLRWGNQQDDLARYCRFTDPEAVDRLRSSTQSSMRESGTVAANQSSTFRADGSNGALNLYLQTQPGSG